MPNNRSGLINILLAGDARKCFSFMQSAHKSVLNKTGKQNPFLFILDNKFRVKLMHDPGRLLDLNDEMFNKFADECGIDVVIFYDANMKTKYFCEALVRKTNCLSIDFDDINLSAIACLNKIELLIEQRVEKSMLVMVGNQDKESVFSVLPKELAMQISFFQQDVSGKISAKSVLELDVSEESAFLESDLPEESFRCCTII